MKFWLSFFILFSIGSAAHSAVLGFLCKKVVAAIVGESFQTPAEKAESDLDKTHFLANRSDSLLPSYLTEKYKKRPSKEQYLKDFESFFENTFAYNTQKALFVFYNLKAKIGIRALNHEESGPLFVKPDEKDWAPDLLSWAVDFTFRLDKKYADRQFPSLKHNLASSLQEELNLLDTYLSNRDVSAEIGARIRSQIETAVFKLNSAQTYEPVAAPAPQQAPETSPKESYVTSQNVKSKTLLKEAEIYKRAGSELASVIDAAVKSAKLAPPDPIMVTLKKYDGKNFIRYSRSFNLNHTVYKMKESLREQIVQVLLKPYFKNYKFQIISGSMPEKTFIETLLASPHVHEIVMQLILVDVAHTNTVKHINEEYARLNSEFWPEQIEKEKQSWRTKFKEEFDNLVKINKGT